MSDEEGLDEEGSDGSVDDGEDSQDEELGQSDFSDSEEEDTEQDTAKQEWVWRLPRTAQMAALAALPPVNHGDVNVASSTMINGEVLAPASLRNTPQAETIARCNLDEYKLTAETSQDCCLSNCTQAELARLVQDVLHDIALIASFSADSIRKNLHRQGFGIARKSTQDDERDYLRFKTESLRDYERGTRESSGW